MGLLPVKAPLHPDAIAGFEKVAAGPAIQKMGQDKQWTTEDVLNFYQKNDPEAIKIMNSVIASIAHSVYAMICMIDRSEERRVGKECKCGWRTDQRKTKRQGGGQRPQRQQRRADRLMI